LTDFDPQDLTSTAVRSLVLYSLAEFQAGHARRIEVVAQGCRFSVADDGRGHAIQRSLAGTPYLKLIYSQLDYPFDADPAPPVQLQGIGMSLLNSLCSELSVSVRKREGSLNLSFRDGALCGSEWSEAGAQRSGNCIAGCIRAPLQPVAIDIGRLWGWLLQVQRGHPGLQLSLNGQELPGSNGEPARDG